jgi:indolepyruvate ferredoxin oxidoreductase alpha subunit
MDTCVEMGASVGMAQGMEAAEGSKYAHNVVAVIGDSTFAHSGITGFINAAYNKRNSLILVLDNGITAMTGMQHNPFSGKTILNQQTVTVDYVKLAESVGLPSDQVRIVNAYKPEEIEKHILEMLAKKKLCLLVVKGPCVIAKGKGRYDG